MRAPRNLLGLFATALISATTAGMAGTAPAQAQTVPPPPAAPTADAAAANAAPAATVTPTLTVQVAPTATVGAPVSATATLAGGSSPGGSVTWALFGLSGAAGATCAAQPLVTATVGVTGNGAVSAPGVTASATGPFSLVATYGGDAANAAVPGTCGAAGTTLTVVPATPTLSLQPATVSGKAITETATLAGGYRPTGSVTFTFYAPTDTACANQPVFTTTTTVSGDASYTSKPFTPSVTGTYPGVAHYSGDQNNTAVTTPCPTGTDPVLTTAAAGVAKPADPPAAGTGPKTLPNTGSTKELLALAVLGLLLMGTGIVLIRVAHARHWRTGR